MDQIGRYRIVSELGRGAMGVVYHAVDPTIGRPVAIKTIRIRDIDDAAERERLRERLFREARSAGVLSHPNIVTIYDMDEDEGVAYIAMAYVNGPTLEKILASDKPLSGANMLRILRQAALALDYAHNKGIVHRDVKPANIMTDEDGAVKVTDFGIAKIASGMHSTITRAIVGTPNYMSPEQVQGLAVDGRSDQFSLAVIAYEILTGERPFTGEHLSTVIFRIVGEEPQPAHRINGTLTPQIDEVLRRGLAKKPEDRYQSCAAFVLALEMACAESRGWMTLPAGAAAAMPTVEVGHEGPRATVAPVLAAAARPKGWRVAPVLLGVLGVLAAMGFFAWRSGDLPGASGATPVAEASKSGSPPAVAQQTPAVADTPPGAQSTDAKADESHDAAENDSASPGTANTGEKPGQPGPETVQPVNAQPASPQMAAKPSPVPVQPDTGERAIRETVRIPAAALHDVWVTSNPPGAKAVMDGDAKDGCATPCMLQAAPGIHHLTIVQAGFQPEYRDINVGETAVEIPEITLRRPFGTLMVTTNPAGANIFINGQQTPQITPAEISLPPGTYNVRVEKDGRSQSETVQLHESPLYLRLPLNQ